VCSGKSRLGQYQLPCKRRGIISNRLIRECSCHRSIRKVEQGQIAVHHVVTHLCDAPGRSRGLLARASGRQRGRLGRLVVAVGQLLPLAAAACMPWHTHWYRDFMARSGLLQHPSDGSSVTACVMEIGSKLGIAGREVSVSVRRTLRHLLAAAFAGVL